jgi:hypothetical protein
MPLFTDIHHKVEGLTPEALTAAHRQDLALRARYGVRFIRYWYDERGSACWLTRLSRSAKAPEPAISSATPSSGICGTRAHSVTGVPERIGGKLQVSKGADSLERKDHDGLSEH